MHKYIVWSHMVYCSGARAWIVRGFLYCRKTLWGSFVLLQTWSVCKLLVVRLGLLTLLSLFEFVPISYVHGHIKEFPMNSDNTHDTRNTNVWRMQCFHYSSSQKKQTAFPSTKLFNSIPSEIKNLSPSLFKIKLKLYLCQNVIIVSMISLTIM